MKKKTLIIIGLLVVLAAALMPACKGGSGAFGFGGGSESLLAGKKPSKVVGVRREAKLNDNIVGPRGDFWKSELTAIFSSSQSYVEYDLGQPTPIRAAYLQADNNDTYAITVSDDGVAFRPFWEAGGTTAGGLQPRFADGLETTARYVRIAAYGGDGSYGISEVQLFSEKPAVFPPQPTVRESIPPDEVLRTKLLALGLALALAVLLTWKGAPIWWTLLVVAVPIAAGVDAWRALMLAWPPATREVALVRGVVAAVGCVVVLREVFAPAKLLADRRVSVGVLATCAGLAVAAFYNLGHPQFHDYKNDRPGFVHNFDMRVYFPIAKYFKELRFDGLYLGSVAAYVDDDKGVTLESLSHQQLRSLRTHRMERVGEVTRDIHEVRSRFSPSRWEEFKRDMRYFRENMGVRDYLGSMSDHGGNATPVWFLFGHALFAKANASNATLTVTAMLDPILLLAALIAIWRSFGLRTALVSAIVFGANDFYMFGTCWAGATLRHDWLAYLALGICALKKEKWLIAGALLMLSGLIRAFPFFALVGAALPTAWWLFDYVREHRKIPGWSVIKSEQRPILLVAASAFVTGFVLWLASSLLFGFHAWSEWLHKVSMLHRDPHVNHVSLRALIGGPDGIHNRVMAARVNVFASGIALFALMVLIASRRKNLAFAATLGTVMIPVVFHPANYYIHFIFVLPLLATELPKKGEGASLWPARPAEGALWIAILALCAGEYFIAIEKDLGLHFYFSSAVLIATIAAMLVVVLVRDFKLAQQLVPVDAATGGAIVPPTAPTTEPEPVPEPQGEEPIAAQAGETSGEDEPASESPAPESPAPESPAPESPVPESPPGAGAAAGDAPNSVKAGAAVDPDKPEGEAAEEQPSEPRPTSSAE